MISYVCSAHDGYMGIKCIMSMRVVSQSVSQSVGENVSNIMMDSALNQLKNLDKKDACSFFCPGENYLLRVMAAGVQ